ncbi:amino acid adenylation domain-containing protein [Caballeronia sp. dw_276]|uniref:amino acid adenylation domain-containing protein n=1 Tax=Caballeronia sp. dw_276 TaxID=2719795 RepID=UPI001BD38E1A|nr:amino acid adenylation domain-containing protein [Caballeronia sp. dw_276]
MKVPTAMPPIELLAPARPLAAAAPPMRRVPLAAACHALRLRLPTTLPTETLESRLSEWVVGESARGRAITPPHPWIEPVPFNADTDAAQRRREAELNLALGLRDASPVRVTLLSYANGAADLILVASRAVLDAAALRRLGSMLVDEPADGTRNDDAWRDVVKHAHVEAGRARADGTAATSVPCTGDRLDTALRRCTFGERFDWARTDGVRAAPSMTRAARHIAGPLPADWTPQMLSAAIGIVMERFDAECIPVLGVIDASSRGDHDGDSSDGALDRVAVRMLPVAPISASADVECTVAALLDTLADCWTAAPVWDTEATRAALSIPTGTAGDIAVGLLLDTIATDASTGTPPGSDYRACLAPPFALTLMPVAVENQRGVVLACDYDPGCFDAARVEAFGLAVLHVLAELQRHSEGGSHARIADIALLEPARSAAIATLRTAAVALPARQAQRIEQRIDQHAAARPDACAISCAGERLSYAGLAHLSRRLAIALRAHGVRPGDRVGVCLERTLELVPALLAVLWAGATYVPLDPAYPEERLRYTIDDARPSLIIGASANLPASVAVRVLDVAQLLQHLDGRDDVGDIAAPHHDDGPGAAAYVIYTSGSTGRPKGVVVPHRNVLDLIAATQDDFGLTSTDVWTLFHSTSFDFSVWEIWGCLATGGHLVVVPYETSRAPDDFLQLLAHERATVLNQTPTAFAQLQQAEQRMPAALALRLVIFGGEALDARTLLPWFDRHPESTCRVVNMFGITETTVHVTAQTITRLHALNGSRSVGRPVPGWHVYVMDSQQRIVPPGVAGEIYVGGAGVADGYLQRDDLTAQRFLIDPYTGGRMYRSGDRGRLDAEGRLEHLGRLDRQVKIRGFRIELDEIRAVLLECASVSAGAVVVNGSGEAARLDAYVVLSRGNTAPVRRQLARVLPQHMVPATVTAVTELPLTLNGKLDTARLPTPVRSGFATFEPAPASTRPELSARGADGPVGAGMVAVLQRIWADVLRTEVGPDDNFFELGGNSLSAVRIAVAIREGGYGNLSMREVYVRQTVRRVAAFLSQGG